MVCLVCPLLLGRHLGADFAHMESGVVAQAAALLTQRRLLHSGQGMLPAQSRPKKSTYFSETAAAPALQLSTGARVFCPVESSNHRPSIPWLLNSVRQVMHKENAQPPLHAPLIEQPPSADVTPTPPLTKVKSFCISQDPPH